MTVDPTDNDTFSDVVIEDNFPRLFHEEESFFALAGLWSERY